MADYLIKCRTTFRSPDEEPQVIESVAEGTIENLGANEGTWHFEDGLGERTIIYQHPHVVLKQGEAVLHLTLDEAVVNDYQTPYGIIQLEALAKRMHRSISRFNLIYDLYQNDVFINRVFIQLSWQFMTEETVN